MNCGMKKYSWAIWFVFILFVGFLCLYAPYIRYMFSKGNDIIVGEPEWMSFTVSDHNYDGYTSEDIMDDPFDPEDWMPGYDEKNIYHVWVNGKYKSACIGGTYYNCPFTPNVIVDGIETKVESSGYLDNKVYDFIYIDRTYGFWINEITFEHIYNIKIRCKDKIETFNLIIHQYD